MGAHGREQVAGSGERGAGIRDPVGGDTRRKSDCFRLPWFCSRRRGPKEEEGGGGRRTHFSLSGEEGPGGLGLGQGTRGAEGHIDVAGQADQLQQLLGRTSLSLSLSLSLSCSPPSV